ncbi:MAG: DUF1015 domain-containing protein [Desulfobulbaceae bacterium]|uniref:DUF1015 domain-containing protein n=1 Tax=Candidatus Desulfobia pelagia TaxID=2841692 RepID=A0A8J6TCG4_9BACT|nr:DUF1015 domain-containing protein [Candidatus Desulfobia pelagia]
MAKVVPFCGLRFNAEKIDRMEDVVTPPYDVVDAKAQAALLEKNPYNMIQLDLTKNAGDKVAEDRYEKARDHFRSWQDQGILVRDEKPAIYLYCIDYTLASGKKFTRKGLVALVELAEFEKGIVKPHEKTFRGVTDDRLRLTEACRAQFSQVFSLYSDDQGKIVSALEEAVSGDPLYAVEDQDGCLHRLWAVTDENVVSMVGKEFQEKSLYIADGHHRYTTALQMRDIMAKKHGSVAVDSPYNFIMMYLCPMEDPGLSVLPTHRLVRHPGHINVEELVNKVDDSFYIKEVGPGTREMLVGEVLSAMDDYAAQETVLGMYEPVSDRCFLLTLKEGVMAEVVGLKVPLSLQELDVVVLSDLVVERCLGLCHDKCDNEALISYFSDPDEALDEAVKLASTSTDMSPILFLMNGTPVSQVKKIADEKLVMPHKSTYFYPKVLTGLVLNTLEKDERRG